jgi:hypothetical protein
MNATLVLVFAITLSALIPSVGTAERETPYKDFYFTIPESMTQTRPPNSEIPVLLGSPGGYPTFNIVVSSTRYDPRAVDIERHSQRTIEEYRKIGLTDAAISGVENVAISELTLPVVKIHYSLSGVWYQAAVAYVPAATKHFVLTYIDLQEAYDRNSALLNSIYRSFRVAESQRLPPLREDDESKNWSDLLVFLGVLVAGSVLYIAIRKLDA